MDSVSNATQVVQPTPRLVADYLIVSCRERGEVLTNLKLQKLLYYSDAWNLAIYDSQLVDEDFQAWVHGPVLLSQYHRFKQHRWMPITDEVAAPTFVERVSNHLNEIIDEFGSETAVALEMMTHKEKPWLEARGDLPASMPSNAVISKTTMKDYYRSL